MKVKLIFAFLLQFYLSTLFVQGGTVPDSIWAAPFSCADDIVKTYQHSKQMESNNQATFLKHDYFMIWTSGEYILKHKGQVEDIPSLLELFPEISLNDKTLSSMVSQKKYERLVDHYYLLKALKEGDPIEKARDGITVDMRFHSIRSLNKNDYQKLQDVFSSSNESLHAIYIEKLPFLFQNNGCTEGLYELKPLIETKVADSSRKQDILALYDTYKPLMKGEIAPVSTLKDKDGKEHTFAEFKGKFLVIDVWATWCSSCLKKMPLFIQLSEKYHGNDHISFITLSIDRKKHKERWLKALEKHGMTGLLNIYPDMDYASPFEDAYHVSGIPRYIILDKEGKIISAFAPSPGDGLEQMVESLLK
jgi:thiol-disulfide isomerase/thioredoxin